VFGGVKVVVLKGLKTTGPSGNVTSPMAVTTWPAKKAGGSKSIVVVCAFAEAGNRRVVQRRTVSMIFASGVGEVLNSWRSLKNRERPDPQGFDPSDSNSGDPNFRFRLARDE